MRYSFFLMVIIAATLNPHIGRTEAKLNQSFIKRKFIIMADGAGNGGALWACLNNDPLKTIRWAQLMDLYEADKEFPLTLRKFGNQSYQQIIQDIKNKILAINKHLYKRLVPYFHYVDKNSKKVDANVGLGKLEDSNFRIYPSSTECPDGEIKFFQLANWTHYGKILINDILFKNPMLAEISKAALNIHEVFYAYLRELYGDKYSVRAREIVGYLFSTLDNRSIRKHIESMLGVIKDTTFEMEFVTIKRGRFHMGSFGQEGKLYISGHVTLMYDYQIMNTEVTQGMYFQMMGENPSRFKEKKYCPKSFESRINHDTGKLIALCPNNPVENVTYDDVYLFLAMLKIKTGVTYKLPSEEEWARAARAGTGRGAYYFGEDEERLYEYEIFAGNSHQHTHPVGPMRNYSNRPNPYGLYDMLGNVSEMTRSHFNTDSSDIQYNAYRGLRGGNWSTYQLKTANRSGITSEEKSSTRGFRLVKHLLQQD